MQILFIADLHCRSMGPKFIYFFSKLFSGRFVIFFFQFLRLRLCEFVDIEHFNASKIEINRFQWFLMLPGSICIRRFGTVAARAAKNTHTALGLSKSRRTLFLAENSPTIDLCVYECLLLEKHQRPSSRSDVPRVISKESPPHKVTLSQLIEFSRSSFETRNKQTFRELGVYCRIPIKQFPEMDEKNECKLPINC